MKLFDNALMTVTPLALVGIWGDLVEAYHDVNSYGGDVAEIYAYRLMPYSPLVHSQVKPNSDKAALIALHAANALCAIIEEFCSAYECSALVDGVPMAEWCSLNNMGRHRFDHRCHVKIERKEEV